jgi:Tol biopolymer transport system component
MRFETSLPGYLGDLALSPDGRYIAYTGGTSSPPRIWIRPIDRLEPRALPGTDNAASLFWSTDSREIGFFADGKLKRVNIAGGTAQAIADVTLTAPGAWTRNGAILYTGAASGDFGSAIVRVPNGGGAAVPVTVLDGTGDQFLHVAPHLLPDDNHFVYLNGSMSGEATLVLSSLDSPQQTPLASVAGQAPVYAAGYLLFVRNGALLAQRFDVDALALRGDAQPLAQNVSEFSVSNTGVLVYASSTLTDITGDRLRLALEQRLRTLGAPVTQRHLVWLGRTGERAGQVDAPTQYTFPMLSPDGRSVAFSAFPPNLRALDVWTIDIERGIRTRVTFEPSADSAPVWSPDGTQIAFDSSRGNSNVGFTNQIFRRAANGTGTEELLFRGVENEITAPLDWSSDGELSRNGNSRPRPSASSSCACQYGVEITAAPAPIA